MRGFSDEQTPLFFTFRLEDRIRPDHPLRDIKKRVDRILDTMNADFAEAYSKMGRPSVPPERLLKALLLMALYSVRSERQLCEQIDVNLLFRWFLDMQPDEDAFDATTFSKNRKRVDEHELTAKFFDAVVAEAIAKNLCSEHFSVDGTLIESYASAKSFQPKSADDKSQDDDANDGNGFKPRNVDVDFHGDKRSNETHASTTDPEAKLFRKGMGKEAILALMGHTVAENRNGMILNIQVTEANGTAERDAALAMLDELKETHECQPKTLGADKGFDSGEFLIDLKERKITAHIPVKGEPADPEKVSKARRPGVKARRTMQNRMKTKAYKLSQKCRKKIEEGFGWLKTIAGLGRSRVVGLWKLQQLMQIGAAAYNLIRMRKLAPVT